MAYTKLIKSGSLVEVYQYEKSPIISTKSKVKNSLRSRKARSRRRDNVARLKKEFVRLVRANLSGTECPVFFTFTMASIVRIELGYRLFTEFIIRLRRKYGQCPRYIAVPEFQKRGAVHFHVLFWGLPENIVHYERMYRSIQHCWSWGFVDCINTDGSPKLASYVAKYMSKAVFDDRLSGKKAYSCSRNVLRPVFLPYASALDCSVELFGVDLSTVVACKRRDFDTKWLGRGRYIKYEL